MKKHSKRTKYVVSLIHGIVLFISLWILNNASFTTDADEVILSKVNSLEKKLFRNKANYDHEFVFINVSRDLKFQSDPDEYGETTITDRAKLAQFFNVLTDNGNRHYFALCDVFLENPSEDDSLLLAATKNCKRYLFPYHLTNDTVQHPILPVPTALSDYITYTGHFTKFKLQYQDSLKTTPLVLLEQINQRTYPASILDFRSVFPQYYIMPDHILNDKAHPYFNLGELLILAQATPEFYDQFLKDKFIVIGNFDTDMHETIAGRMPGSLILVNTYLTLFNSPPSHWLWVLFMVIGLSLISYLLFYGRLKAPVLEKRPWTNLLMHFFINKYFSFSGICLLLVIISTLLFSVQLNIALLLTYLYLVQFSMNYYRTHFNKPR